MCSQKDARTRLYLEYSVLLDELGTVCRVAPVVFCNELLEELFVSGDGFLVLVSQLLGLPPGTAASVVKELVSGEAQEQEHPEYEHPGHFCWTQGGLLCGRAGTLLAIASAPNTSCKPKILCKPPQHPLLSLSFHQTSP